MEIIYEFIKTHITYITIIFICLCINKIIKYFSTKDTKKHNYFDIFKFILKNINQFSLLAIIMLVIIMGIALVFGFIYDSIQNKGTGIDKVIVHFLALMKIIDFTSTAKDIKNKLYDEEKIENELK